MKTTKIRRCVMCGTILLTSQHKYCTEHNTAIKRRQLPPMKKKPPIPYFNNDENYYHKTTDDIQMPIIDTIDFLLYNRNHTVKELSNNDPRIYRSRHKDG